MVKQFEYPGTEVPFTTLRVRSYHSLSYALVSLEDKPCKKIIKKHSIHRIGLLAAICLVIINGEAN